MATNLFTEYMIGQIAAMYVGGTLTKTKAEELIRDVADNANPPGNVDKELQEWNPFDTNL